ncbi:hypothetical protein PV326_013418 [Microctonus aethiopoides]|nr:hypothetical protein PV326_013418 [Microctonus aethiopoides]
MISVIFVACLLAGSALGQPWLNRGNVMPMQPYHSSPNVPTYALYPCESREDPNGQWVYVRNQQHYVHVAECQQYNGQNNCAYQSAQNYVHPQSQPMMYIQPTNNCARQNCEQICIQNSCFISAVTTPNGYTGVAPTPAPTSAPVTTPAEYYSAMPSQDRSRPPNPITTFPEFHQNYIPYQHYPQHPQIPNFPNSSPNFQFIQNSVIRPSENVQVQDDSEEYQQDDEVPLNEEIPLEPTIEENKPRDAPAEQSEQSELTKAEEQYVISNPSPVHTPKKVECTNVYGCAPGSQQHVGYHQFGSSSSAAAASAASAGSASASASASAGSASASASAAASSAPHMAFPGVPLPYNQPLQNQASLCKSNGGSNPCEVQYKKSASVNQNGITIEVNDGNDDVHGMENQSPCQNSPCMQ